MLSILFLAAVPAVQAEPAPDLAAAAAGRHLSAPEALSRGAGLLRVDGAVRALGDGWKARLEPRRVVWTPYLGPDAPRNLPLTIELVSVLRGGEVVWTPTRSDEPAVAGLAATYDRGGGVLERYEARPEGLAQSFAIEAPLDQASDQASGTGDLVVRLKLTTDLDARGGGGAERLRFGFADLREVSIGAVTGIDANGATRAGELRLDGDVLDLVLPADFVDHAAWPLIVDPLIGPEETVQGTGDTYAPDVARAESGYLVVWSAAVSALDWDVVGRFRSESGGVGPLIPLESADDTIAVRPRVSPPQEGIVVDSHVVAWEVATGLFSGTDIEGRACASATQLGELTTIAADPGLSETELDLGAPFSGETPLVYNASGAGIRCAMIDTWSIFWPFALDDKLRVTRIDVLTTDANDSRPDVSEHGDLGAGGMVAWQRFFSNPAPGDHDVYVARYVGGAWQNPVGTHSLGIEQKNPTIDGIDFEQNGGGFVLAYSRGDTERPMVQRILLSGATSISYGTQILAPVSGHSSVEVASTGHGFPFATQSSEVASQLFTFDALTETLTSGTGFSTTFQGPTSPAPRIATEMDPWSDTGAKPGAYMVYEDLGKIRGRTLDDGMGQDLIEAECGAGRFFASELRVGEQAVFELRDAKPFAVGQVAIGFAEAFGLVCGSCRIVPAPVPTPILINGLVSGTGEMTFQPYVPSSSSLVGAELYTQALTFHLDSPGCAAWNLEVTDALHQVIH